MKKKKKSKWVYNEGGKPMMPTVDLSLFGKDEVKQYDKLQKDPKDYSQIIANALALTAAALPGGQIPNPQVQPGLSYNPIGSGTGSQAIFNDGGKPGDPYGYKAPDLRPKKANFKNLENSEPDLFNYREQKEFESAQKKARTFKLQDPRKVKDSRSGNYDPKNIKAIIQAAKQHGVDPYDALAIGMQESGWGNHSFNLGEVSYAMGSTDEDYENVDKQATTLVKALKDKFKYADQLGIQDPATRLQTYNGLGKLKNRGKMYGIDTNTNPIDMRKTPLYGNKVMDLRDNVLKKNKQIMQWIQEVGDPASTAPTRPTPPPGPKMKNGGKIKPISSNTLEFKGPSHEQGGIDLQVGNRKIEVEGDETAAYDSGGNLTIFGNLKVPGSDMKFKDVARKIGEDEARLEKTLGRIPTPQTPVGETTAAIMNTFGGGKLNHLKQQKEMLGLIQQAMLGDKKRKKAEWGATLGDDPRDKFRELRRKTIEKLQALYPKSKIEVKITSSARDITTQKDLLKKGASQTSVSLHNFDAARDFMIYKDGKAINDSSVYKKTLHAAAKELELHPLNWEADPGHIGLVPEGSLNKRGGAVKQLLEDYPELKNTPHYRKTIDYLKKVVENGEADSIEQKVYGDLTGKPYKGETAPDSQSFDMAKNFLKERTLFNPAKDTSKPKASVPKAASKPKAAPATPAVRNPSDPFDTANNFLSERTIGGRIPKKGPVTKAPANTENWLDKRINPLTGEPVGPSGTIPLDNAREYDPRIDTSKALNAPPSGYLNEIANNMRKSGEPKAPKNDVPNDPNYNLFGPPVKKKVFTDPKNPKGTLQGEIKDPRRAMQSAADQNFLDPRQFVGEIYALVNNKVEPVQSQRYSPELLNPYQVSFQDRLNENQSTFNAMSRNLAYNPTAIGALSAQKFQADSNTLAEEFRTNQGISNDITNRNKLTLNDAQFKNLGIADTQAHRQAQAKSKTKATNQLALQSIGSKMLQHKQENLKLRTYEPLFDYRYTYDGKGSIKAMEYQGPEATFDYGDVLGTQGSPSAATQQTFDPAGNLKQTKVSEPSQLTLEQQQLRLQKQRQEQMKTIFQTFPSF
jgi:hypothetical protein